MVSVAPAVKLAPDTVKVFDADVVLTVWVVPKSNEGVDAVRLGVIACPIPVKVSVCWLAPVLFIKILPLAAVVVVGVNLT